MGRNFIRDGIEVKGYFSESKLTDEFRFWFRPTPPKAAEVEVHQLEVISNEPDKVYDMLVAKFQKAVVRWDCEEKLDLANILTLNRLVLWRAVRLILGTDRSDNDPKDTDDQSEENGKSIVGKSNELTS